MRLIPSVFVLCLVACSSSGGEGDPPMCEADTEADEAHNLVDEIGLGVVGIEAYRSSMDGAVTYQMDVHGDDAETTQIRITFQGMPVVGMAYPVTEALSNDEVMIQVLPVSMAPALVTGTMTFTEAGTMTGETLAIDMDLEFETGKLVGCMRSTITATGDPDSTTDSGSDSGSETADSTG
jgi:hypothetical protein